MAGIGHLRQHIERRSTGCRRGRTPRRRRRQRKVSVKPATSAARREARRNRRAEIVPGVIDAEIGAVQRAPDDEGPGGAVPEPAEQHGDHQIDVAQHPAAAVAAERDVEIVAQELRQRHVPAPPEIDDAGGLVGRVEIERQEDAEHQRYADRHVGIAGEIEIELEGIGQRADPGLVEGRRRRAERERDQRLDAVGEAGLLEQADREDDQAAQDQMRIGPLGFRALELRDHVAGGAGSARRSDAGNR